MQKEWLPAEPIIVTVASRQETPAGLTFTFVEPPEQPAPGQPGKKPGEIALAAGGTPGSQQALVSVGPRQKLSPEAIRRAGGGIARWIRSHQVGEAAVDLSSLEGFDVENPAEPLVEGLVLGAYRFSRYKTGDEPASQARLTFWVKGKTSVIELQVNRALALASAVNLAREWGHEPANVINPVSLAERVQALAAESGLKVRVIDDQELSRMGAGAILAVGRGSQAKPRLIIVEYPGNPENPGEPPVVLVGKTITFDTGGYSLKTLEGMRGMKYDKCGGLAVMAALQAVSALKLRPRVVGIIAAAENMISGDSYRVDDILTSLSGKTIEVLSTDAEGRLVLADAVAYAQREYHPRAMIDLATLTGGVVVALGSIRAGLMANDDRLADQLFQAGEKTFERLWRLPLDEEYFEQIRGDEADIKNSGGRQASAIIGGTFIRQFVDPQTPWAHLDIAGTADTDKDLPYCTKGATGFGVRLLVDYLSQL